MKEQEYGVGHIAHSNHQGIILFSILDGLLQYAKKVTFDFTEIQLLISNDSQNDVSIMQLPKIELPIDPLLDHATPNKKPFLSVQSSSTSTQNDNPYYQHQTTQNDNPYYQHQTEIRTSYRTQGQFNNMMTETNVTTTTVAHRNQLQLDIFNKPYSRMMKIESSGSRHYDFTNVRDALAKYYEEYLRIQRVSGETHTLEKCYINLAIVKAIDQHQIDKEQLKAHSKSFIRMQSYENVRGTDLESTIQIEDIFIKRKLRGGKEDIPKKILIQGRAGIGKTTLCKKLVHQFIAGSWRDRFEAVLWIPLRQLKVFKSRNLKKFIKEKYFAHSIGCEGILTSELITEIQRNKVLFILDGLDEIIHDVQSDIAMGSFVKHLLQQTHIIITSRPSGVDNELLPELDLELETVGFNSTNISDYVNNVLDEEAANSVMEFIRKTPIIKTLANIPVQLDVICYSWESLPIDTDTITITKLYQAMVDKLWRNDGIRLEKSARGKMINLQLMKKLSEHQLSNLMSAEMEYLSYLAFIGMNNNQIEFDIPTMTDVLDKLDNFRKQSSRDLLPLDLLEILEQTSFLHSTKDDIDSQKKPTQQSYHFIHLTFQEYFAASWLSKYFNIKTTNPTTTSMLMNKDETISFIQKNKYNPRYEIVWWMVAGQLEGEALESYLQLLQSAPRDLIGVRHQYLIAGCYREARSRLSTSSVDHIQSELIQLLRSEMTVLNYKGKGSIIGRQSIFPEDILIKSIKESNGNTKQLFIALQYRRYLESSTVEHLIQMLSDENSDIVELAVMALGRQVTLSEFATTALITALQGNDSSVRRAAAEALGNQSTISESTVSALIAALWDNDLYVQQTAARVLGNQSTMSESTVSALITALQDIHLHVRIVAAEALGKRSTMSESTVTALITALRDNDPRVQQAAAKALGNQSTMSKSTVSGLITALQDNHSYVRHAAAKLLGNQSTMSESTVSALITALQGNQWYVRQVVVEVLGNQSTMSESTISALITSLQDNHRDVQQAAVKALGNQSTMSESTVSALITALQANDWYLQQAAVEALGKQSTMSESTISALITSLQDNHRDVQQAAVKALGNQSTISESTVSALITAFQDNHSYVRHEAVKILGNQSTMSESTVTRLIDALWDNNSYVRQAAAEALCNQSTMSESTISALITALQDNDWYVNVRQVVVEALGKQSIMSESTVTRLITALWGNDSDVRRAAVKALGNQSTMSEYTVSALITALQDNDSRVQQAAAKALCNQSTMSESTITTLITALQDNDWYVRQAAVEVLGNQSTMPESTITTLITALWDNDSYVRRAAVKALGNQSIMSESTVLALTTALQDNHSYVRHEAAKILGNQSTMSESTVSALITALQDNDLYIHVRQVAVEALGNQSTMSESTISALITALWDNASDVRWAAVKALGNQSTMSESTISALIIALQDSDWYVRQAAVEVLGNQSTMSESTVSALITALLDNDSEVRRAAVKILGNQYTMSGYTVSALITTLQGNDINDASVRYELTKPFSKRPTMSKSTISQIVTTADGTDIRMSLDVVRTPSIYLSGKDLTENKIDMLYTP